MKDKLAREQIDSLIKRVGELEGKLKNAQAIELKYCPKCKHDTIQKPKYNPSYNYSTTTTLGYSSPEHYDYFVCLNCGKTIKHTTKHTTQDINEIVD